MAANGLPGNDRPTAEKIEQSKQRWLGLFSRVWAQLADEGWCDSWGSVECERITADWFLADCPVDIPGFIRVRANQLPPALVPHQFDQLDQEQEGHHK